MMSRRLLVGIGGLALAGILIVVAILVRALPAPEVVPTPDDSPALETVESTALIAARDDTGAIAGAVLLGAHNVNPTGSWVDLQPGLSMDIAESGTVTLAMEGGWRPETIAEQVGMQLGVWVDTVLVMDRLAFAGLVDSVGGVSVDVPRRIVAIDPSTGQRTVVARPGLRHMFGPTAARYALTLTPNETQLERMERFHQVLEHVILQLPGNPDRVRSILGSLGALARTLGSFDEIARILLQYQTAAAARGESEDVLPARFVATVRPTPSGESAGGRSPQSLLPDAYYAIYRTDPVEVARLMRQQFRLALRIPGENGALPRVRVLAAGVPNDVVASVRDSLFGAGFSFVWGGPVPQQSASQVRVSSVADRESYGLPIAAALGLPESAVVVDKSSAAGVQAAVIVAPNNPSPTGTPTGTASPTPTLPTATPAQ